MPRTLYEKIWEAHVVRQRNDGTALLYIDRHLIHEVTSPQAIDGLRLAGRKVRRPDLTLAVPDHNQPTTPRVDTEGHRLPIADRESAQQLAALSRNTAEFGIELIDALAAEQGIVHVIGPEQGFIRAVIAPSFSDIFSGNAFKNGILTVMLPQEQVDRLLEIAKGHQIAIEFESQTVTTPFEDRFDFDIDPFRKQCLLKGLDEIAITLEMHDDIAAYEAKAQVEAPWVGNAAKAV